MQRFIQYATAIRAEVPVVPTEEAAAAALATSGEGDLKCTAAVREQYPAPVCRAGRERQPGGGRRRRGRADAGSVGGGRGAGGGTGLVLARAGVAETGSLLLAD